MLIAMLYSDVIVKKFKDGQMQTQTQTRKSKSDFKRFISYVVYTSGV